MNNIDAISGNELRDLYRELILDHARHPRHFGKLDRATHSAQGINPLCGDKLDLFLELDDDVIRDAAFEGAGCAISLASASLLTDTIIGLKTDKALDWFEQVTTRLSGNPDASDLDLGKLQALEGVREFPSRVKCATLAWHALRSAIEHQTAPATTE